MVKDFKFDLWQCFNVENLMKTVLVTLILKMIKLRFEILVFSKIFFTLAGGLSEDHFVLRCHVLIYNRNFLKF